MAGSAWTNQAQNLIIVQSGGNFQGLFVYNPTPGAGNLSSSIVTGTGTDPYGNAYLDGVTNYGLSGSPKFAVELTNGAVFFSSATTEAGPWTSNASLGGLASPQQALEASPALYFVGQGSTVSPISGGPVIWGNGNSNLVVTLPTGQAGQVGITQGDTSTNTVTAASATQITRTWVIAAGDMNAGTKYRIRTAGFGTQGSTAQNLIPGVGFGGVQKRTATISSAVLAINAPFSWQCEYTMMCLNTGAGGHVWLSGLFTLSQTGITYTLATAQLTVSFGSNASAAGEVINTTASTDMELFMSWGSTTGAPTITSVESSFERIGI